MNTYIHAFSYAYYLHHSGVLLVAAFVSLLSVTRAHSWGTKGHEIVAAIAETHLTDTARRRIKELLPQGTT
jgi:hypothetical protein